MSINMEFRNVVFNAARDGKLRRLKVRFVRVLKYIESCVNYFDNISFVGKKSKVLSMAIKYVAKDDSFSV